MHELITHIKLKSLVQSTRPFFSYTITSLPLATKYMSRLHLNINICIVVNSMNEIKRVAWDNVTKHFSFYKHQFQPNHSTHSSTGMFSNNYVINISSTYNYILLYILELQIIRVVLILGFATQL